MTTFHPSHTKCLVTHKKKKKHRSYSSLLCFRSRWNGRSGWRLTDTKSRNLVKQLPFRCRRGRTVNKQQAFNNRNYHAPKNDRSLHAIRSTLCDTDKKCTASTATAAINFVIKLCRRYAVNDRKSPGRCLPRHLLSIRYYRYTHSQHCTTSAPCWLGLRSCNLPPAVVFFFSKRRFVSYVPRSTVDLRWVQKVAFAKSLSQKPPKTHSSAGI